MKKSHGVGFLAGAALISASTLFLIGCGKPHEPLMGTYIGDSTDGSVNGEMAIIFDKFEPSDVVMGASAAGLTFYTLLPVTYSSNKVTVKRKDGAAPLVFEISPDTYTLTCSSCPDKNIPTEFHIRTQFGAPLSAAAVDEAFHYYKNVAEREGS